MNANQEKMTLRPIGVIHSPFREAAGTPIQPRAGGRSGTVEVFPEFADGLKDLDGFERIWLIYWFHEIGQTQLRVTPYMDTAERGLFATRAPCRPNPIGLSCVQLVGIRETTLDIADLDILDGTPLLDIKPYASPFDCFDTSRIGWLNNKQVQGRTADERFHDRS